MQCKSLQNLRHLHLKISNLKEDSTNTTKQSNLESTAHKQLHVNCVWKDNPFKCRFTFQTTSDNEK